MATAPGFAATPRMGSGIVSAANTNRDGTGTLVTIMSGGASGTKLERVRAKAIATTTAGMLRFFLWDGSATFRLIEEIIVAAITPSGSAKTWEDNIDLSLPDKLTHIPSGWSLVCGTHVAENFHVEAFGGDF